MPTSLSNFKLRLTVQVSSLNSGFSRHLTVQRGMRQRDRIALREGYISALWQYWGQFMRSVLVESAKGAIRDNGVATTCPFSVYTEEEIAFVCKQLSTGGPINQIRPLKGSHLEPTWGDVGKAIQIASQINISNQAEVLAALAIPLSLKDLQLCRNATAHLGSSTFSDLKAAKVRYLDTKLLHPTDAMMWTDKTTAGYLWDTWVDDILVAADFACK